MRVRDLRNLGPRSEAALASIGIDTAGAVLGSDPFDLYARLKAREPATSLNFLYALIGAQEGQDWRVIQKERRTEILLRLDDLGLAPR